MGNVPALRFSEFGGVCEVKHLGDIAPNISYGLTVRPTYYDHGIPLISAREIKSGFIDYDGAPNICQEDFDNLSPKAKAKQGDIFLSKTGTIGRVAYVSSSRTIAITQNISIIRADNEKHFHQYILQYLKTEKFQRSAIKKVNQSTIMDLQLQDIKKLVIPLPSLPEQQKIATFLSAVDKKLGYLRGKHALLEIYKRGIMQKLFSPFDDTQGKPLRFKQDNGADFPDWEEKRLGDVFKWVRTNNLSRAMLTDDNGEIQNIHYGDIHTKYSVHFYQKTAGAPYIINPDIPETDFCENGDLIIADASEDYNDIGKSIEIINVKPKSLVAGLHTYIARPKIKVSLGFSGYLFQASDVRIQIKKIAQGISVLGISKTNLEKIVLLYPHPEEQQKIVNFLSTLDKKLETVQKQIDQTKTFKKGLLQKMFV